MEIKIGVERVWGKVRQDRMGVVVEFPNCISTTTKKSFKWMPTYSQLEDIKEKLIEVEKINEVREKCKKSK